MTKLLDTVTWSTTPRFMMRFGGIPVEAVRVLESPAARGWADRTQAAEDRVRRLGDALDAPLHDAVGGNTDDEARRELIKIRRRVLQGKPPGDVARLTAVAATLDEPTRTMLLDWAAARGELEDLRAGGAEILADELGSAREGLERLARDPRLRNGILLAAPELDQAIDSYLRAGEPPNKRRRKAESSFLHYIYRTAFKTSPFSTFTTIGVGEFAPDAAGALDRTEVRLDPRGFARLNIAVLSRITEHVRTDPGRRAHLPVRLASGLETERSRLRFVRKSVKAGDDSSTVAFDTVTEDLLYLTHTRYLDRVFALFEHEPLRPFSAAVAELSRACGADLGDCDAYLGALLRLGLLECPLLALDPHCADPVRELGRAFGRIGAPWADDLAEGLAAAAELVAGYSDADRTGRKTVLEQLRGRLSAVLGRLGLPEEFLPQTLVFEDVRAASDAFGFDPAPWRPIEETLRELAGMSYAFDATLPHRILLKGYFLARFGRGARCDDVISFLQDFQEEVFDSFMQFSGQAERFDEQGRWLPQDNWMSQPEIEHVDRGRAEFVRRVRLLAESAPQAEELELDSEFVASVSRELDPVHESVRSQAHFLQLIRGERGLTAVLNRTWGGLSLPYSRFTHCFQEAALAETQRVTARRRHPEDLVLAELTGGFHTTNLNLHQRMTDYEIVCPAETSFVPPEAQLPLEDLYLEHDAETDELVLRSRRLDRRVVPVYLGFLMPMALPDIPRSLLLLSPSTLSVIDVWGGFPGPTPEQPLVHRPRVRLREVVLSRRMWLTRVADLPPRASSPGLDRAAWFLAWRRWRSAHGLPERAFVTVGPPQEGTDGADGGFARPGKPHYVDFGSVLSLSTLEELFEDGSAVATFAEMLPDPEELHVGAEDGTRVCELVVEMCAYSA